MGGKAQRRQQAAGNTAPDQTPTSAPPAGDNAFYAEILKAAQRGTEPDVPHFADYPLLQAPPPVPAVAAGVSATAPTGLASKVSATRFLDAAKPIISAWSSEQIADRYQPLVDAINGELAAAGVPPVDIRVAARPPDSPGRFDSKTWAMVLSNAASSAPAIGVESAERLVMAVYHEARHAEQFFTMARWRLGQSEDFASVIGDLAIPGAIGVLAEMAPPLDPDAAARAEVWSDSRTGPGEAYQDQAYAATAKMSKVASAADAVVQDLEGDPRARPKVLERAKAIDTETIADADAARAIYKALPLESDAWEATTAVDEGFDGKVDQF